MFKLFLLFLFRLIVDKIDQDKDGFITLVELKDWIRYTQRRYIADDVERQWKQHNPENKPSLTWEVCCLYFTYNTFVEASLHASI